jgi:hypothetical protein
MRRGGGPAWLLVKKADEFAGGDPVKTSPKSVKSGKTVGFAERGGLRAGVSTVPGGPELPARGGGSGLVQSHPG